MAKKIIKEPTIRRYKATCPICGCEFEFDTTDASWSQREVNEMSIIQMGLPLISELKMFVELRVRVVKLG